MAGEATGEVREICQAIRELIPALHAMAESNCRIAEALIAAGSVEQKVEDPEASAVYLDGTPIR